MFKMKNSGETDDLEKDDDNEEIQIEIKDENTTKIEDASKQNTTLSEKNKE